MSAPLTLIRRRALWVLGALSLGVLVLAAKLVYLQVFQASKLSALARAQRTHTVNLSAERYDIVDCNGQELAGSVQAYSICAMPSQVKDFDPEKTASALAPVLGMDVSELEKKLEGPRFRWIARKKDLSVRRKVLALNLPGIQLVPESRRVYPNGTLASTLLGFVGLDNQGLSGMEYDFDKDLHGPDKKLRVQVDAYGREIMRENADAPLETAMGNRNQVVLTLDRNLQHIAERELTKALADCDAERGVIIVMDPHTGGLLTFASSPTFDPNQYWKYTPEQTKNWAITDVYEPGSTMKMFTVASALDKGRITPDQVFDCPQFIHVDGRVISDHEAPKGVRHLTPFDILEQSSNIGATKIAFTMTPEEHRAFLVKMGFGHPTMAHISGESGGILPPLPWAHIRQSTIAFGQGVSVTPLQLISAASAIGNDGVHMRPRFIDKIVTPQGALVKAFPPESEGRVLKGKTCDILMRMLEKVVEGGTGVKARVPGYLIAGKTGTAQKISDDGRSYSSDVIASFLGFVPSRKPRYVMLCVVDRPRKIHWASETAVPLFGRMAAELLRHAGIQPTEPLTTPSPAKGPTPHDDL